MKPILCLDFDGVIHSYESGWMVRTYLQDEALALHGPMPTEELANEVALEQIEIALKALAGHASMLRQATIELNKS